MTIAVDFDGVIHAYSKGWHDGTIYDKPVDGAFESLEFMMKYTPVFIFTSRNVEDVGMWITINSNLNVEIDDGGKHPIHFWNKKDSLFITNRKLPATHYIDDRAVKFNAWDQTLKELDL